MANNNFHSNFTERQLIRASDAGFKIKTVNGIPSSFSTQIDLESYDFDMVSEVVVDVYCSSTNSRLSYKECGTIGNMNQMEDKSLENLDSGSLIKFTVKVVTPDDFIVQGLIEGVSTFQTEEVGDGKGLAESSRNSLLPVNYGATDLGQIPCRLRFEENGPYLDVNSSIEDAGYRMVNSPYFRGVQFPVFVEVIVTKAFEDLGDSDIGDGDEWYEKWARFAMTFMGGEDPREPGVETGDWVFDLAKQFAERWDLKDNLDDHLREVYGG